MSHTHRDRPRSQWRAQAAGQPHTRQADRRFCRRHALTINKLAAGISDNLALGLLNEAIGLGLPVVVLPFLNSALAAHPAFDRSVRELRGAGAAVLLGDGAFVPHPPNQGVSKLPGYLWETSLPAVEKLLDTRSTR